MCDVEFRFFDTAAPSGPPQNLSVVTVNSRTLLLSWDPPIPEEQNGIIEQYIVTVSSTEEEDSYQLETNFTELKITELHPHYTYSLTVAAVTIATGPFCEPQTTTMPQDGKPLRYDISVYMHSL